MSALVGSLPGSIGKRRVSVQVETSAAGVDLVCFGEPGETSSDVLRIEPYVARALAGLLHVAADECERAQPAIGGAT